MKKEVTPFQLGLITESEKQHLRFVRSNFFFSAGTDVKTVLVATDKDSAAAAVGILKFASALTGSGKKVLVIDSDRDNACLRTLLNTQAKQNLNGYLTGTESIETIPQTTTEKNLDVIFCEAPRQEGLGDDQKMSELLAAMKKIYDFVFLLASPESEGLDIYSYDEIVDATMIVAREMSTSHKFLKKVLEYCVRKDRKVVGIMMI